MWLILLAMGFFSLMLTTAMLLARGAVRLNFYRKICGWLTAFLSVVLHKALRNVVIGFAA